LHYLRLTARLVSLDLQLVTSKYLFVVVTIHIVK